MLFSALHSDKPHRRPARCLTNRFGIIGVALGHPVILTALDIRFNKLRADQPYLVSKLDQFAAPVMSATARFHGDHAR